MQPKISEMIAKGMKMRNMTRPVDLFKALVDAGYEGTYQTVLNWVDGTNEPLLKHLVIIARALNLPVAFFAGDTTV